MADAAGRPSSSLHYIVGEMNGKLDALLIEVRPAIKNLEGRVVYLEKGHWKLVGAGALVSILLTAAELIRYGR